MKILKLTKIQPSSIGYTNQLNF